eukprot:7134214-Pyramimonas_sp.AAC.1
MGAVVCFRAQVLPRAPARRASVRDTAPRPSSRQRCAQRPPAPWPCRCQASPPSRCSSAAASPRPRP